eukprot:gene779-928_t
MSYHFPTELAAFGNERWCKFTLDSDDRVFLLRITPDGEKMENISAMHIGDPIIIPDETESRTLGIKVSHVRTRYMHGFHRLRFDTDEGLQKFVTWKNKYFFNGSKWLGSFSKGRITSDSYRLYHYLHYSLDTKRIDFGYGEYEEIKDEKWIRNL